jgi:hypothetical protein
MPPFCVPRAIPPFSAWNAGDVGQYNAREVVQSRDFDARRVADVRHLEGGPASEVSHFQVCLNSALIVP